MLRRLLNQVSNRDLTEAMASAKSYARERLRSRTLLETEAVLRECRIPVEYRARARVLLEVVADLLEIPPGYLRHTDRLGDLLRVETSVLEPVAQQVLRRYGITQRLEVLGYDLLHLVERLSDVRLWSRQRSTLSVRPSNDDEWIEIIMGMDVAQFLIFFSAAMRPS